MLFVLITTLIKFAFLAGLVLSLAGLLTWMERVQSAYAQDRRGPEWASLRFLGRSIRLWGLLHPLADGLKMFFKESFRPQKANRLLFWLAPLFGFATALMMISLVPFGPDLKTADIPGIAWFFSEATLLEHPVIPLQVARLDAGILWVLAMGSLGMYGVALAGYASNSRFAMMGGLRALSQGLSYELPLGLAVACMLVTFGSAELSTLVTSQNQLVVAGLPAWGLWVQPLAAVLFLVAVIAESKRGPFDTPEGESEILGYFVEYSSMGFGMFMLSEFMEVVALSAVFASLFLGGWQLPWLFGETTWNLGFWAGKADFFGIAPGFWNAIAGMVVFGAKVFFLSALQLQIRWTLPRFRYDQVMSLGWKIMLPLGLANVFVTTIFVFVDPSLYALSVFNLVALFVFIAMVWLGPKPKRVLHFRGDLQKSAEHG